MNRQARASVCTLAARSGGRLRVLDEASACFRLRAAEEEPAALYESLKELLRP
jgi:hypothetical protein